MHSFKLAATLQHTLPQNPHPLLLRVDKKAGHGAGKSTEKRFVLRLVQCSLAYLGLTFLIRIQEAADKWGFVAQSLGLTWKASFKNAL
jgi:prolyl oligopeptidase